MAEHEKFGAQMDEKLKLLKEKIDTSKAKAEARGQEYINKYEKDLEKLESKYDLARYKLKLLRTGGKSAWGDLREGFEKAYNDLKDAVNKAKDKF
jgi:hypothetical protein